MATSHDAWEAVLETLRREASPFRAQLFQAQTALVGWESDDELLIVAGNGFVLDQLRAFAGVVLVTLRRLVGDGRALSLRYTTWDALIATSEAGSVPAVDAATGPSQGRDPGAGFGGASGRPGQ